MSTTLTAQNSCPTSAHRSSKRRSGLLVLTLKRQSRGWRPTRPRLVHLPCNNSPSDTQFNEERSVLALKNARAEIAGLTKAADSTEDRFRLYRVQAVSVTLREGGH